MPLPAALSNKLLQRQSLGPAEWSYGNIIQKPPICKPMAQRPLPPECSESGKLGSARITSLRQSRGSLPIHTVVENDVRWLRGQGGRNTGKASRLLRLAAGVIVCVILGYLSLIQGTVA